MKIGEESLPFITIGIASYNYGIYLKRAFEAIKNQEFTDFELLYSDDCSSDDSVDIIEGFIRDNPDMNIRLIKSDHNRGVMENKNTILDNAQGEYLMLCDADDWMLPNCLHVLGDLARNTNADQVIAGFQNVDNNGKVIQIQEIPNCPSRWLWATHHATLYKTKVIKDAGIRFSLNYYPDDLYFNLMFHHYSNDQVFSKEIVYCWFMHDDSTSARSTNSESKSMWEGYNLVNNACDYILPVYSMYSGDIKEQIEYLALKLYGVAVYYRSTSGGLKKLKEFLDEYALMNKKMRSIFPEYKRNRYALKIDSGGIVRFRTALIIYATVKAEKFHMIKPMLILFWLVSKFHPFVI